MTVRCTSSPSAGAARSTDAMHRSSCAARLCVGISTSSRRGTPIAELGSATPIPPFRGVCLALRVCVSRLRAATCPYCPPWVTAVWLLVGVMALLYAGGCRRGVPVVDLGPKPPAARGTITGLVHGPGDAGLQGRVVEIVNVESGAKHTATTASNGGFTIELPKGKYRLELQ